MRTVRNWAIVLVLAVAAVVILRLTLLAPHPLDVEVFVVAPGLVEETVTNTKAGTVRVHRRSSIGVEAPGRIVELPHREGSAVAAGDVLLRVDDREAQAALERARRERSTAAAELEATRTRCDLAAREAVRLDRLWKDGISSEEAADRAQTAHRQCLSERAAARERALLTEAAVEQAGVALEKTVVLSPFEGVVTQLLGEVGEWGTPGVPVLEVMESAPPFVRAELDEVDLARVTAGLPVRVTLDPYADRDFAGVVTRVAPNVSERELQNRTLEIDVAFREPEQADGLKPGTSADVEVILERREDVLRVPTYALLEGDKVLLVEDGRAAARPVETGLRNWDFTEVLSGLARGERVVVSLDKEGVVDGAAVEVVGERER
jgi:HlyD family secretion protein